MMKPPDLLPPRTIGVSISASQDMRYFGFADGHLKDVMAGFAIHLLASGANLAYGGDLRDRGFTRLIFDLVLRHRPHTLGGPPVIQWLHGWRSQQQPNGCGESTARWDTAR